jgi:hypothetical protein
MLMQTSINIECGPKLQTKLTVHEEMLCCHSKPLQARFLKAKSIRQQFVKADDFRDQLAAYVFPETTPKEFEDDRCDQKVCSLKILWSEKTYVASVLDFLCWKHA